MKAQALHIPLIVGLHKIATVVAVHRGGEHCQPGNAAHILLCLHLDHTFSSSNACKYRANASCHFGKGVRPAAAKALQSSRLFSGRRAAVGYAAVEIGSNSISLPARSKSAGQNRTSSPVDRCRQRGTHPVRFALSFGK